MSITSMKIIFNLLFLLSCLAAISQRSSELLVYSVKGTVSVVENKRESPLKIGKILKPASVIKTQQDARITMICEQGKLLNLTKKGSFAVQHWKDSCSMVQSNLTADYFRYIWEEMVGKQQGNNSGNGGVRRSDRSRLPEPKSGKVTKTVKKDTYIKVDTLSFASGNFPLLRVRKTDSKKCLFVIMTSKGEEVYKDSLASPVILTNTIIQHLQPGNSYSWTARFEKDTPGNSGVLNYFSVESTDKFIVSIEKAIDIPEDEATLFFRVAYLLERNHYLADAYTYYQKAAKANPSMILYRDKLFLFRKEFGITT